MKNNHQDGRVIDVVLAADVASGDVVTKGRLFAIAVTNGKTGDVIAGAVEGVFELPKPVGTAIAQGAALSWDVSAGQVITAGAEGGDIENFGFAAEASDAPAGTVYARLCPGMGIAKPGV